MDVRLRSRLVELIFTSTYALRSPREYDLHPDFATPDAPPSFWPEAGVALFCGVARPLNVTGSQPREGGIMHKSLPQLSAVTVRAEGEDGRSLFVGKIPTYIEFWEGTPPSLFRPEVTLEEYEQLQHDIWAGSGTQRIRTFFQAKDSKQPVMALIGKSPIPQPNPNDPTGPKRSLGDVSRIDPIGRRLPNSCWERICCIGLDVERSEVNAIIEISQQGVYGGSLCDSNAFESVGFWLIEPSRAEIVPQTWPPEPESNPYNMLYPDCVGAVRFIGSARSRVADIPRRSSGRESCQNGLADYDNGLLYYSVSVPLNTEDLAETLDCSDPTRLPVLHAVVSWNRDVTNENFSGDSVLFGDVSWKVVQFPVHQACKQGNVAGIESFEIDATTTNAIPVHVANLPDGTILFVSGSIYGKRVNEGDDRYHFSNNSVALLEPSTNRVIPLGDPPFDIFCAGHSTLADGNVLIVGGTFSRETTHREAHHWPGLQEAAIYDWRTRSFKMVQPMREGRWYPSTVVLGTGDIYVCDGHPTLNSRVHTNFDLEIYDSTGTSIIVSKLNGNMSSGSNVEFNMLTYMLRKRGVADKSSLSIDDQNIVDSYHPPDEEFIGLYPRLLLLPNGRIFSASIVRSRPNLVPTREEDINNENRIGEPIINDEGLASASTGRVLRNNSYEWDPYDPSRHKLLYAGSPDDYGPIYWYSDPAVLLPLRIQPSREIPDPDNPEFADVAVLTLANEFARVFQPMISNPVWHNIAGRSTNVYPGRTDVPLNKKYRVHGNAVLMPNGSVMLVGGVDTPYRKGGYDVSQEEERFVQEIEYLMPKPTQFPVLPIQERWTWKVDTSFLSTPRRYHSSAILLPDGRVMVGGGDYSDGGRARKIELITPYYMQPDVIRQYGRPRFTIDRKTVPYGGLVRIVLEDSSHVTDLDIHAMLIRCASFTHAFGYDQRAVQLFPHSGSSLRMDTYSVRIPNNPNVCPPGYYMLFITNTRGIPSCAQMLQIVAS